MIEINHWVTKPFERSFFSGRFASRSFRFFVFFSPRSSSPACAAELNLDDSILLVYCYDFKDKTTRAANFSACVTNFTADNTIPTGKGGFDIEDSTAVKVFITFNS